MTVVVAIAVYEYEDPKDCRKFEDFVVQAMKVVANGTTGVVAATYPDYNREDISAEIEDMVSKVKELNSK